MAMRVLSATVEEEVAAKLERLARATNRKKSYYVNAALKDYLEEIEDYDQALERRGGDSVTVAEGGKRLTGPYRGLWSHRFSNYRIIYEIEARTVSVVVLRVRNRRDVYDGL